MAPAKAPSHNSCSQLESTTSMPTISNEQLAVPILKELKLLQSFTKNMSQKGNRFASRPSCQQTGILNLSRAQVRMDSLSVLISCSPVTVPSNGFATPEGIHVGSTSREVIKACGQPDFNYNNRGNTIARRNQPQMLMYKATDGHHGLSFRIEKGIVTEIRVY